MVYNTIIFSILCQCNSHNVDYNDIINKLNDEINVIRNNINYNDLVNNINNSNNIINNNIVLKEIFDTIWISLGLNGFIINQNENYILLRNGFDYLYNSLFQSIFTNQIINTNGIKNIIITLIDERWKLINNFLSQTNDSISNINIYIYYYLIFETVDVIFSFLNIQHHSIFLWILLTNIIDISKDGSTKCRDINSIDCILDINNNVNLSLNLKQEFYNMAMKNQITNSEQKYQIENSFNRSYRRPVTANNVTTTTTTTTSSSLSLSYNQSKQEFINELNQYKEAGIPFRNFLSNGKRPSSASTRPSSASVVPTVSRPINPHIQTVGTTKWTLLSNLLKHRTQLIEGGEKVETTFIEDWKPLITASLLSDFERNRNFKLGMLSKTLSPQQQINSTNFSPIRRPKSSVPFTSKFSSSYKENNIEQINNRPQSSPTTRPRSSSAASREKKDIVDFDGDIYLSGEKKPVYKIIESKETDDDTNSKMSINDIAEKLMSSTTDIQLERNIEQDEKIEETIDSLKVSKVITLDQTPVSIETFLFNADTISNRTQAKSSSDSSDLPHFSSFLDEQQIKLSPQSPKNIRKEESNNIITNVNTVHSSSVIYMRQLSPKQSANSILHNLSMDVEGDGDIGQNLSLDFVPSPSMYSNELIDTNFSFVGSNELFSHHGGSYLEQRVDPYMKSQKQEENLNLESNNNYDKKFKLDDYEYYASASNESSLEVLGIPISPKQNLKKQVKVAVCDYESITDSSRCSPTSPKKTFSVPKTSAINDFPVITDENDELNSISPVSSVVIKLVNTIDNDSDNDNDNDNAKYIDNYGRIMCPSSSVNTVAILLSNTIPNNNYIVVPPVELKELGRSLNIPVPVNTDVIRDTCFKKNLQPRRDEIKSPSIVKKLHSHINKSTRKVDDTNVTSKFLNDPKYPKINLVSSISPWKPIYYNPYIDPILNGSTHTWQERKLSHQFLTQDINHMIIDVKKQSASRYEFEKFAEIKTPSIVKDKKYNRKVYGILGKKKPLVPVKKLSSSSNEKSKPSSPPIKEPVIIPVLKRRSAFVQVSRESTQVD